MKRLRETSKQLVQSQASGIFPQWRLWKSKFMELAGPIIIWGQRRVAKYPRKALVPLAILVIVVPYALILFSTGPVAERKPRPRVPRLVETIEAAPDLTGPQIAAWGEVIPSRGLTLRPEVSGTIKVLHPQLVKGGIILAGEWLVELERAEAVLALETAEAAVAEVEARIAMERGQGKRAARDLERTPLELTGDQRALVLREPQMARLAAELASANAGLEQAHLNLSKTVIRAPFDALVTSEQVARGAAVTAGAELATLVAIDRFTVSIAVPAAALEWIDPDGGAPVRLLQPGIWPEGEGRMGRLIRSGAQLTEAGRMVEILVEVEDPLSRKPENADLPRLILGSFLRAEFDGRAIPDALVLDRDYLRDGNKVWVMTDDDRLDIREVTIAWQGAEEVLIAGGLTPGERIVTTNLAVTAQGMKLRIAEDRK